MKEQKKEPKWLSCYNFMSMLNIPEVKSEFYGKRGNLTYSMLQRINKKLIFEKLIYNDKEKQTTNFARYKNIFSLMNDLTSKRPIQCYYYQRIKFIIVMDTSNDGVSYVEVIQKTIEDNIMKVPYFEWDVNEQICSSEINLKDVTPCLLLPNLLNKAEKFTYCCISKDWKVLKYDGFEYIGL